MLLNSCSILKYIVLSPDAVKQMKGKNNDKAFCLSLLPLFLHQAQTHLFDPIYSMSTYVLAIASIWIESN